MCLALVAIFPLMEDIGDTGGAVTDGTVADSAMAGMTEAKVERETAPAEHTLQALPTRSTSGDGQGRR